MALKAVSDSVYRNNAGSLQKPEHAVNSGSTSVSPAANIYGAETSAKTTIKTTGSNQFINERDALQKEQANDQQIKNAIRQANNQMKALRTRCEFSYHEETRRVSIKVYNKDTDEIIREIPPEETLEMIEKIWDLAGLLVDERV